MARTQSPAPTIDNEALRRHEELARVGSVANAPWFHLQKGNLCQGVLENVYTRPDERSKTGTSKFFQIRLSAPCLVREDRGENAKVITVEAGKVVNVNYGPKTKELEKFVASILMGAEYQVSLYVEGDKFAIGKGQTMWPIDVRALQTKAPVATDETDFSDEDDTEAAAG